jgi:ABC-2 type transport system ATP-binding protein
MDYVCTLDGVTKRYGKFTAVNSVNLHIPGGIIYGILGPNGAGKTSTLRMVNAITAPDEGTITILGQKAGENSQQQIGYLPEERGLYKKMKVGEQLLYLCQLKGLSKSKAKESINYWLERFEASTWIDKEINELSKGMQQKIQFIATIAHDPEIYIFDEPFSGLDPINSELLKEVILDLKASGKSIIFATHRMEQVEQMCDNICLFNKGSVILEGELSKIKRSYGENTIIINFDGSDAFIDNLENVRINNKSNNFAEIRLLEGADDQQILRSAMENAHITRFQLVQPSLQEIFISSVNSSSTQSAEA